MKLKKNRPKQLSIPAEELLKRIGKRLKELRIAKGYTSYEIFAYEHDIPRSQYGKYEKGDKDLRISSLSKIVMDAHGMTLEEFFSEGFD